MNLLIVDDNATNRKLLRAQLESEGHSVVDAINGVEALKILDRNGVDGVVSDILMPDMDGYRLCLEIRKKEKTCGLPFIFYTSTYSSPQDQQLAKTVGADNYLSKPASTEIILRALQEAMQKTRPRIAGLAIPQDESYVLKQYNASLVHKLEQRNTELEAALKQLQSIHGKLQDSEEQLRLFVEHAPAAIAMLDNNMRYIVASHRWNTDFRLGGRILTGLSHYEVFPDIPERWKDIHRRCLAGAVEKCAEDIFPRSDGSIDWLQWETHPWHKNDGSIGGIIVFSELVTERKLSQAALLASEQRFRAIFDHAGIGITMRSAHDRNSPWIQVNDHFCKLLGYTREELLKLSTADITPDDHKASAVSDNESLRKGDITNYSREKQVIRKDGQRIWVVLTVASLPGPDGRPANLIATYQDITRRKEADFSIRRLNRVYAVLSGINSLIARVHDLHQLLTDACRIAVEQGEFELAWVGNHDPKTGRIVPVAWAGKNAGRLANAGSSASSSNPLGAGVTGQAILNKTPVFVNDLTLEPDIGSERRREVIRLGYHSSIGLPLVVDGKAVSVLTLYVKEPNFFDKEEVDLLTELASNISIGMESIARQHKLQKLSRIRAVSAEINAAIMRIHEREALLKETCRIASEYGGFELAWIGVIDQKNEKLHTAAWSGFPPEIVQHINWSSLRKESMRTREPYVRRKLDDNLPAGPLRRVAIDKGYSSSICLPLVVDDEVVAIIFLFALEEAFFDDDELALLKEVSADISLALQTIAKQEKLDYLSYYDPLTGLPNRSLFMDRASQKMRARIGESLMVALILINIERFRNINETYGRHGGDELLKMIASRLESAYHGKDFLARIGADGFGIVVRGTTESAKILHSVEDQVLGCFREPFSIDGNELRVAAKAGVAVFPTDGNDADTLFRNAEAALKKARESGERYLFYATEMNARAAQALTLETKLRRAVEKREFVLHYQPKYTLATGKLCGMEALIRWQDPASGLVAPGIFIPLLEETGLILEVGGWALDRALAQHREWTALGLKVPRIAVNVSSIQLQQKNFADVVINAVQAQGDNPDALELEVTESLLMKDVQASLRMLSILRGLGITIAMDDFGTGYSSLAYIARLPITSLKIDRSFITGMAENPQNMGIVTTIIALAHSMNLKVVAEGVETEEQSRLLKALECDEVQGYLFSKPVPGEQIEAMLRSHPQ